MKYKKIKLNQQNNIRLKRSSLEKNRTIHNEEKLTSKNSLKKNETYFKKVLNIIQEHEMNNQRILFIGFPEFVIKKVKNFSKTNHTFISESIWTGGIISNKNSIIRYLFHKKKLSASSNKNAELLFNLKMQHNLVVILDTNYFNKSILFEISDKRIPVVFLSSKPIILAEQITYKVSNCPITYKKNQKLNVFLNLLISILKKRNFL